MPQCENLFQKINEIQAHKNLIHAEKSNVNLNIINLNFDSMKEQLCARIDVLVQKLIDFQVETNTKHTKWYVLNCFLT